MALTNGAAAAHAKATSDEQPVMIYELELQDDGSPSKQRSVRLQCICMYTFRSAYAVSPVHSPTSACRPLRPENFPQRGLAGFKSWRTLHKLPSRW